MRLPLRRRQFMIATLAGAAGLPRLAGAAGGTANLVVERRTLEVKGRAASVFRLGRPDGTPGLTLPPGARFVVDLVNRAGEETVIHWHGQTPPNVQDGVEETGSRLIPPGGRQGYDFAPRPGTHWMHSHHGLQEQVLLAAPLIVHTAEDAKADLQEVVVLLHDFSFKDPAELLAQVAHGAMAGMGSHGSGTGTASMSGMGGMAMPGGTMAHGATGGMSTNAAPDLNDVDYDAYLANDRTLDDPLVVRTERSGRVRMRLINGATSTAFWIDLGGATATVLAVDGNPVRPVSGSRFPLAQGQRLDLLVTMPGDGAVQPILAQREGDRVRTGIILAPPGVAVRRIADHADTAAPALNLDMEATLAAAAPLTDRPHDVLHKVALTGSMMPYVWGIDGRTWADHVPLKVARSQRVRIEMVNETAMAHPMHLHGHHFQVVDLNGRALAGAMRDTVLVPPRGRVSVVFDADNPGRWVFHCHNLLHMATGMMTEVAYT